MPLEKPDYQHLRAACGYIALGMFEEGNAELEEIDPFYRHLPEVLTARVIIYRELKKWDLMVVVTQKLAEWNPSEPGNFIDWAYATRRAESIHLAHTILTRGAALHPDDGLIQFNLACYEAQIGGIDQAKMHLARAIKADAKFSLMALDDPDLEPLWGSLPIESVCTHQATGARLPLYYASKNEIKDEQAHDD
jgi:tetratricopeptide (TPR) repeat protein